MSDSAYLDKYLKGHEFTLILHFIDELSARVNRSPEALRLDGLQAGDFPVDTLIVSFEDDTKLHFKFAFHVRRGGHIAVFTEHAGYHVWPDKWETMDVEVVPMGI